MIYLFLMLPILVLLIFLMVIVFKGYRRCPPGKVLVIYGRMETGKIGTKCIQSGAAFVFPFFQDYCYLDLKPMDVEVSLSGALSRENKRVDVLASFTVGILTEPNVKLEAVERLIGLDSHQVVSLANELIMGQLRLLIAVRMYEELSLQNEGFVSDLEKYIGSELNKIGLKLISFDIHEVRESS